MKKFILFVGALVIAGSIYAGSARADTSGTVSATIGARLIAITLSDTAINFGHHALGTTDYIAANKAITVTNAGTEPVNLLNSTTNFVGTDSNVWVVGGSADVDRLELMSNAGGGFTNMVPETLTPLWSNLASGATKDVSFQANMPTSSASVAEHTATITIVAN